MDGASISRKSPGRWTRRKESRPAEILDAAVAVFAERGFAAARMEDIAQKAGVTKEEVFKSLVRDSIGRTIGSTTANARTFEGRSSDLIRMVLGAIGNLLMTSDRVVLPKIIIAEAGNFPELARFYREEIMDRGIALMTGIVERGIARGEFRKLPAEHVTRLCIAPILLIALWRTTFAKFDAVPYDFDGLIQTHIDVLLRGLAPDPPPPEGGHS